MAVNTNEQDAVAILNSETFEVLFAEANPMRVTVRETSKLTTWTVEDGTQRTDHRVVDAIEIDIPFMLTDDTRNLFEQMRQSFLNGDLLIVQTKARSYPDMMIYEIPHEETPDMGVSLPVAVKLREIRVITPEFGKLPPRKVKKKSQSDTVSKGQQQTTDSDASTQRKASILYGITS